jgi:hypothetical protein
MKRTSSAVEKFYVNMDPAVLLTDQNQKCLCYIYSVTFQGECVISNDLPTLKREIRKMEGLDSHFYFILPNVFYRG